MGMKQFFFFFFRKKKFKMADSKKAHFSKSPILKIFSRKFLRLVLGLVGLNDAKGIDVAQRIWPWGCPTKAQKQPISTEKAFIFCFIPMKISPNLYGRMDGSKFRRFPWFLENSLLCVILRYTVYEIVFHPKPTHHCTGYLIFFKEVKKGLIFCTANSLSKGSQVWIVAEPNSFIINF